MQSGWGKNVMESPLVRLPPALFFRVTTCHQTSFTVWDTPFKGLIIDFTENYFIRANWLLS
jgi:hypothetical protein